MVVEVAGPLVAQHAARLAGVGARHDGAVLGAGNQCILVAVDGAGLRSGDEAGADPHTVGAEGERGGEAAAVEDPPGGDDRHLLADGVDDLRDEGHRGDGAGVATRLGALGDDEVAPAGDGSDGVAHLAAHRADDDVGVVQGVDDVAGHARGRRRKCRAAVDDVPDAGLHLVGHGGQQVDAERLRRASLGRAAISSASSAGRIVEAPSVPMPPASETAATRRW